METSSHEGEIPIPINSVYGHMIHHHHHLNNNNNIISSTNSGTQQVITIPSPPPPPPPPTTNNLDHHDHHNIINNNTVRASSGYEKSAEKYRECLKNHAAAMGGNATDGCGEFMPSGEEGSLEALTCSACNCHRNFHRKEVERKLFLGHHPHHPKALMYSSSRAVPNPPHQQMIMPYSAIGPHLHSESDEHDHHHHHQVVKKRFRTKFTQEQKEKMVRFAERVGWKIQKQEEGVVQQLCQEIGIKRRVLKVWMHNNKAKKAINPLATSTA